MPVINRLEVENIKRIKVVRITPEGKVVVIGGKNGEGKTSALDSIAYLLGGKNAICDEPLRRGEKKGRIIGEIGDLTVRRTFTEGGTYLEVTTKDGAKYPSPQAILDKMCSALTFDPLAYLHMKPDDQRKTLLDMLGEDYAEIEQHRAQAFADRTDVNRDLKKAKARLEATPMPEGMEDVEPVDLGELADQLNAAVDLENRVIREKTAADNARAQADRYVQEIAERRRRIELLEQEISALEDSQDQCSKLATHHDDEAKRLSGEGTPDTDAIRAKIDTATDHNNRVMAAKAHKQAQVDVDELADASEKLTTEIEALDKKKSDAVKSGKLPVEGLGFDDHGPTFNGIPFSQSSSAEQLRVSCAMAIAMNAGLNVILIRDGSLLDDDNLALIGQMAEENDCQIWIERVGEGKECSLIIEDGAVRGAAAEELQDAEA